MQRNTVKALISPGGGGILNFWPSGGGQLIREGGLDYLKFLDR